MGPVSSSRVSLSRDRETPVSLQPYCQAISRTGIILGSIAETNTTPAEENPLPGYCPYRLNTNSELPSKLTATERAQHAHIFPKVRALIANGLTRIDLTRCWVSWRILPLSRRGALMCEYTGSVNDPQHFNKTPLSDKEINAIVKLLLGESQEACKKVGLNPFCVLNPAPAVSILE